MKPRRTILSVPGYSEKMHQKAGQSTTDVVMLDLEDSVTLAEKERARENVIRSLHRIDWNQRTVTVRINGLDTPLGYQDLIAVVEAAGPNIDAVVVPKCDHPGDVYCVSRLLDGIERRLGFERPIGIEACIESAEGLSNMKRTAKASNRLKTLVFGIADYSASIGLGLTSISGHGEDNEDYPGHRWNFELSRLVMAAKAAGLMAIDAPYGEFNNKPAMVTAAKISRALGFDGKWAIHPNQLEPINTVFSPSAREIDRAVKVLDAVKKARDKGHGAVAVDGRMVDNATVRLAMQAVETAQHLGLLEPEFCMKFYQ